MNKTPILLICMLMIVLSGFGQGESGFTGFGNIPVKTPDSLLRKWRQASDIKEQMAAGQALTAFHANHGTTDSVIIYSQQMMDALNKGSVRPEDKLLYQSRLHHTLADANNEKGLYDEALRHYLEGIRCAELLHDDAAVNENKLGIANVYFTRNEYDKAIEAYNNLLKTTTNEALKHIAYKQLGVIYLRRNELVKAKQYAEEALLYFQQNGQLKNELETKLNLGIIAELNKNTTAAFTIYNEVKNSAEQHQFFDLYINAGQKLGDLFIAQKDYENAKGLLSMVYTNAMQWSDMKGQLRALNSLRTAHAATGDYKNAYALMTQYMGVFQEVLSSQNKKEINELEIKYKTVQKEKEILSKENELQHQKTIKYSLLIGFLVILLPVISLLYVYYQKLQTQSKLNATITEMNQQKITALLKDKELALLKASVSGQEKERKRIAEELHDSIGGNLAAIKLGLSHHKNVHGLKELILQVDDTYHQVRDLSHDLVPQKFDNTGFTELISGYVKQFNVPGNAKISFQAYPEEAVNLLATPLKVEIYKVIQELITNAQKHAMASKVEIQLTLVDNLLKLLFEDDGKGFSVETTKYGIGFQNIQERLKLFDGVLSIDSFPSKGTVVDIEIQLKPEWYEA